MPEQKETEFSKRYSAHDGDTTPGIDDVVGTVLDDSKEWLDAHVAYSKLVASERLGKLSGTLVIGFIMALFVVCGILMGSVALALWLGQVLNSPALGFLSTAGILIAMAAIVYFVLGSAIRTSITLSIINTIHEKD